MNIFLLISFSQFIIWLQAIGVLVAGIIMLIVLSDIMRWLWNTVVIGFATPFLGHRAYYYIYKGDDLYSERFLRFLGIKMPRNKKWAVHTRLAGYVKKQFITNNNLKSAEIFTKSFGLNEQIGIGKFIDTKDERGKIVEICIRHTMRDGSVKIDEDNPVGYVNAAGIIYKYYANYTDFTTGKRLTSAEKIGFCATVKRNWWKRLFFSTNGEKDDAEVVKYIADSDEASPNGAWNAIRKNKHLKSKVRTSLFSSNNTKGSRPFKWLFIWRYIDVMPFGWTKKAMPFGFGYARKNFDYFKSSSINELPLIYIACAALLLIEQEEFFRYEEETTPEPELGWNETVLVSLLAYLGVYKLLLKIPFYSEVFPFIGPELSQIVLMTLSFFGIWAVFHFFYNAIFGRPMYMKRTLNMLNSNVGTLAYSRLSIATALLGIILTIFFLPFTLLPMFLCVIITFWVNRMYCPQIRWNVDEVFGGDSSSSDSDDANTDGLTEIKYEWQSKSSFSEKRSLSMSLFFSDDAIKQLRTKNPFINPISNYTETVSKMLLKEELNGETQDGLPSLEHVVSLLNHLKKGKCNSKIEHVWHYLNFVQGAIKYETDEKSEPLKSANINNEYCRFARETLFDMEGDCDCKSALAAAILAQSGMRILYIVSSTHAFIGISKKHFQTSGKVDFFWNFIPTENIYTNKDGEEFLCFETTGLGWTLDETISSEFVEDIEEASIIDVSTTL